MRKLLKRLAQPVLIPFVRWYLQKERHFRYQDIRITILPGVFHPGFFFSTKFLLGHLDTLHLARLRFLELGCGSGLISIYAAKKGAVVTASDISKTALKNTELNASANDVSITIIESDLFDHLTGNFDVIVINPPYYPKKATKESEFAWHCGENFEYFRKLFLQLPDRLKHDSQVLMVLTKGCDLRQIFSVAKEAGLSLNKLKEQNVFFDEKDFLFSIKVNSSETIRA
jgi:release factor glutamine methyltransferase